MVGYTATQTRSVYWDLVPPLRGALSHTVRPGKTCVPRYLGCLQVSHITIDKVIDFLCRVKLSLLRPTEREAQLPAGGVQGEASLWALRPHLPHFHVCKTWHLQTYRQTLGSAKTKDQKAKGPGGCWHLRNSFWCVLIDLTDLGMLGNYHMWHIIALTAHCCRFTTMTPV